MSDSGDQDTAPKRPVVHCVLCDKDVDITSWNFMHIGQLGKTPEGEKRKVCHSCSVNLRTMLDIHDIPPSPFWSSLSEVLQDADLSALYGDMRRAFNNYNRPIKQVQLRFIQV